MNSQDTYRVTKELRSDIKFGATVSIYAKDILVMAVIFSIAYSVREFIADSGVIRGFYWGFWIICAFVMVIPSPYNQNRRMYQSIYFYLMCKKTIYHSILVKEGNLTNGKNIGKENKENPKRKKKKREKLDSTADIFQISYNKTYQCFELENNYMDLLEIRTRDIVNASEDDVDYDIAKLTKFNKLEYEPYKIISLNFPCNTIGQQEYIQYKIDHTMNPHFKNFLEESMMELKWVHEKKTKREFYLMYFSDSLEGIKTMNMSIKTALNTSEMMIKNMTEEKKRLILYRLNNPASILQGGVI